MRIKIIEICNILSSTLCEDTLYSEFVALKNVQATLQDNIDFEKPKWSVPKSISIYRISQK